MGLFDLFKKKGGAPTPPPAPSMPGAVPSSASASAATAPDTSKYSSFHQPEFKL